LGVCQRCQCMFYRHRKNTRTAASEKNFRECCESTVLTTAYYWTSSYSIPVQIFLSVMVALTVGVGLRQRCVLSPLLFRPAIRGGQPGNCSFANFFKTCLVVRYNNKLPLFCPHENSTSYNHFAPSLKTSDLWLWTLLLFIVYESDRQLQPSRRGVTVGIYRINHLLFADGLLLLACFKQGLRHVFDRFSAACDQAGMKISIKSNEESCSSRNPSQYTLQVCKNTLQ